MGVNIDFSALDALHGNRPPPDARQQQPTKVAVTINVQAIKKEISRDILSGREPYPVLLMAIKAIAELTGDTDFLIMCEDTMNGAGMLRELPDGWELDGVESDLKRLETIQSNINKAIKYHRQRLEGQVVDPAQYEYMQRIRRCFADAYQFFDTHKQPRTDADWERIAGSLSPYKDLFTAGLVAACWDELEREYKETRDG